MWHYRESTPFTVSKSKWDTKEAQIYEAYIGMEKLVSGQYFL